MKKKHHTPEQIITKLRTVERLTAEGTTVKETAEQIEVSEETYYRRREYGGIQKNQFKQLKKLQKENDRLKAAYPNHAPWVLLEATTSFTAGPRTERN